MSYNTDRLHPIGAEDVDSALSSLSGRTKGCRIMLRRSEPSAPRSSERENKKSIAMLGAL